MEALNDKAPGGANVGGSRKVVCGTGKNHIPNRAPAQSSADPQNILNKCEKVILTAPNRWKFCCPSGLHQDRHPSAGMMLVDGKILLKCFFGCTAEQMLAGLGLSWADVFPSRKYLDSSINRRPKFSPYELFPLLVQEALILALAFDSLQSGSKLSGIDEKRAITAFSAVMRLHTEVSK